MATNPGNVGATGKGQTGGTKSSKQLKIDAQEFLQEFEDAARRFTKQLENVYFPQGIVSRKIKKEFQTIVDYEREINNKIIKILQTPLKQYKQIFKQLDDLHKFENQKTLGYYNETYRALFTNLQDFSSRFSDLFAKLGQKIGSIAETYANSSKKSLQDVANELQNNSTKIADSIAQTYKSIENDLMNILENEMKKLKDPKQNPIQILNSLLTILAQKSQKAGQDLENSIKNALANIKIKQEDLADIISLVTDDIQKKYQQMAGAIEDTIDEIQQKIQKNIEESIERLKTLGKWFQRFFDIIFGYEGLRSYAQIQHEIALTTRQMAGHAVDIDALTQKFQKMGMEAEIGAERFTELATKMSKLRIINLQNINESKEFITTLGRYTQMYKVNAETIMGFMRESRFLFKLQTKDVQETTQHIMEYMNGMAKHWGLTTEEMEGAWKDMTIALGSISEALVRVDKTGKVAFDTKKYEQATLNVAKLSAMFSKLGIEAGKAGEMINNMMDIDRIGKNAFALSQLGISITEAITAPEKAIEKLMKNLPVLAEKLAHMNVWARHYILKNFEGMLPKEVLQKLRTGSIQEIRQLAKDWNAPINETWRKTKDDLMELWEMIKNITRTLVSMLHPVIGAVKLIAKPLMEILTFISKLINNKYVQGFITALIAGKLISGGFNFLNTLTKSFSVLKQSGIGILPGIFALLTGKSPMNMISMGGSFLNIFKKIKGLGGGAQLGIVAPGFEPGGILDKINTGVGGFFSNIFKKLFGGLGKLFGGGGKLLGGGLKGFGAGLGAMAKTALPLWIASGIMGGISSAMDTSKVQEAFNIKNPQQVKLKHRLAAGITGMLNALTFGLIPKEKLNKLTRDVAKFLDPILKAIESFINSLKPIFKALWKDLGQTFGPILKDFGKIFKQLFSELKPLFVMISKTLKDAFQKFKPILKTVLKTMGNAIKQLMQALVPVVKMLMPLVQTLFKALMPIWKVIYTVLAQLIKIVAVLLKALMPVLQPIIKIIIVGLEASMKLLGPFLDYLQKAWKLVGDLLEGKISFGDFVKKFGKILWKFFVGLGKAIIDALVHILKNVPKLLWNAVQELLNSLGGIFKSLFGGKGKKEKSAAEQLDPYTRTYLESKERAKRMENIKTKEEKEAMTVQIKNQKIQEKLLKETEKISSHTKEQVDVQKDNIFVTSKVQKEIVKLRQKEGSAPINYETAVRIARNVGKGSVGALNAGVIM